MNKKIKVALTSLVILMSFITTAFAETNTATGNEFMDMPEDEQLGALGGVAMLVGGSMLLPGAGVVGMAVCWHYHCISGTALDDFVPADMSSLTAQQQYELRGAVEFFARNFCMGRGWTAGQWTAVNSNTYSQKMAISSHNVKVHNEDAKLWLSMHPDFPLRNLIETDTNEGLAVHADAEVTDSQKAHIGMSCISNEQSVSGTNYLSHSHPVEFWVNKKGQIAGRYMNENPMVRGISVTREYTWTELANITNKLEQDDNNKRKSDF